MRRKGPAGACAKVGERGVKLFVPIDNRIRAEFFDRPVGEAEAELESGSRERPQQA